MGSIQGHSLFLKVLGDLVTQSCWSQDFQLGGQPAWALSSIVLDFFLSCLFCFLAFIQKFQAKWTGEQLQGCGWISSSLSVLPSGAV